MPDNDSSSGDQPISRPDKQTVTRSSDEDLSRSEPISRPDGNAIQKGQS